MDVQAHSFYLYHFSNYFFLRFLHSDSNYSFVGLFEVVPCLHWCSVQIFFVFSPCVLFIYIYSFKFKYH